VAGEAMKITAFICDQCGALKKEAYEDIDTGKHYCEQCKEAHAIPKEARLRYTNYELEE
jgi:formylmethanofuran dehydrogenase subunit E